MKNGRTLPSLVAELERQLETKKDLLVPSRLLHHETQYSGTCHVSVDSPKGPQRYGITPLARRQLASKLNIPFEYFERMRSEKPELLDSNVNAWLQSNDERRLVRTLDGNVRAVLSDRYRRLDNYDLLQHVMPMLRQLPDARFESVGLTDTKLYVKVVTPRVSCEIAPGDVVQAGVVVCNSEVGHGTLTVQPLIYRLVCRNGLIASDSSLRKSHVGRTLTTDDDGHAVFKDDTLQADDRAFFLKVRDVVEAAVSATTFNALADKMRATRGISIARNPEKSVEVLAQRYTLNDAERIGVMRKLILGGDMTGYGLVNAVTHYSQEVEDYDRASEFEVLGGKLIAQSAVEWKYLTDLA